MHEIICPHCSKAFKIDEAGYANILKQVRDGDFDKQLHERLELAEREKRDAIALAEAKLANELQGAAARKDAEIQALKAQLDAGEVARKRALAEALSTPGEILPSRLRTGRPWTCAPMRKLPFNVRKRTGNFNPGANAIQVMTMQVSKGLAFPVVVFPSVGHMSAAGSYEAEAAQVFDVAATRAKQRLVMGVVGDSGFSQKLR